ncbi:MAG: endolytic transglycosylase MltG [Bacteroidota bacterium]|nr:endolytic transglycosylase MltG [Bacteroidota bacterium]
MKKVLVISLIAFLIVAAVGAWMIFGPATGFESERKALYIRTKAANKAAVLDSLRVNKIVKQASLFSWMATRMNYWKNIKPGKYDIKKGSSLISIIRQLRNGQQTPVNFTITKIRLKEDLARMAGNKFEFDSADMIHFLNNADSLKKYNADPETALWVVMPDTYIYFWNTTPEKVYKKMAEASKKFWTEERKHKAAEQGITPVQTYILASIIDEETNASKEKATIASVYLNRIRKGMPLQADPTIKFALKDFSLKRIYEKHLFVTSPYNTYRNRGIPPGPICTPSKTTIDAVLNAPHTDYLYFAASPDFNGTHIFATTYSEHMKNAHAYQQALNERIQPTE